MKRQIERMPVAEIRRRSIVSFGIFILLAIAAFCGWHFLQHEKQVNTQKPTLTKVLQVNEKVNKLVFDRGKTEHYAAKDAVKKARVNGNIGLAYDFEPADWKLTVFPTADKDSAKAITMNIGNIKSLPKRDVIFDFKCIEGWSQVTHWGGTRFSDFLAKYHLGTKSGKAPDSDHPEDLYKYVGLMTPNGGYYVGIDMASMLNPQTILCYELNDKPLSIDQGYPLRLIITVKYGIKSLKCIGFIYFSDTKPPDYWNENGYDYDAAL